MDPRAAFVTHCLELLAPLGAARARRMFGGHGLYLDDLFVAIVAGEVLYLKTDAQTQDAFERAGGRPFTFTYESQGRTVATSYWSAPDAAMESPPQMRPWARRAIEAALRARASKPASRRRSPAAAAPAAPAKSRSAPPAASRSRRAPRGT